MAAEDDIASIETQIVEGVVNVRHSDGRQVEYAPIESRLRALGYFRGKASSAGGVTRSTLLTFVRD